MQPEPLRSGQILSERFEIRSVLGRGGFGIAYMGRDLVLEDLVAIKELAPEGSRRDAQGILDMSAGASTPQLLRARFLEEAQTLARLHVKGVLPVRASFSENGTAYYVTEFQPGSETLDHLLRRERQMDVAGALDIFLALLDILEAIHAQGILHRDIKPSNILISESGQVTLIDFGAARGFHADAAHTHTVMYTPGYAPPEQLSERARRGPATDIYALCATLYHMLAGVPPDDAAARVAGATLRPIRQIRPDIDRPTERVVESGLAISYTERPQSADEVRQLLAEEELPEEIQTVEALDRLLVRLSTFTYDKRSCPACDGVLIDAKPLRKGACPTCRRGTIRKRKIEERLCPVCKLGALRDFDNVERRQLCPHCSKGLLHYRRKGLLSRDLVAQCDHCEEQFDAADLSTNPDKGGLCTGCQARFEELPDGRWKQVEPRPRGRYVSQYPEEWARVAAGLAPGAGNAECDSCGADYYLENDAVTLLDAPSDPFGFAADYTGRLLSLEDARWLGIGKQSPQSGLVCEHCPLEFDFDGSYLRLVQTDSRTLARFQGQPKTFDDWQRLAHGLPSIDQEDPVSQELDTELRKAYWRGDIGFDGSDLAWRGDAVRVDDRTKGVLNIGATEISHGGMLRKWRVPRDAVLQAEGKDSVLRVLLSGSKDWVELEIAPMTLFAHLESGDRALPLNAADLAKRLSGGS
jgi:hypothetical protein